MLTVICGIAQPTNELLTMSVKASAQEGTIQDILNKLAKQYNLVFSYEPSGIPLKKVVKLPSAECLLKDFLDRIFKNTGIIYSIRSNVIILKKNADKYNEKVRHTISGVIKDAKSGETIIGATIFISDLKTGEIANEYGFYSLTLPEGAYQIQISSMGYKTLIRDTSLTSNIRFDVELLPEARELQEVIVTKQESNLTNFQQGFSTIEMKTVKELPSLFGEADLLRNILLLPGVTSMAELGGDFQVRGGSWDQNLMLLDEAVVYNSNHLMGIYSTFNPDIIKDIKFYKSDIPANYGGRISSVMDISQKEGNMKSFHMSGGVGLIASKFAIEGPIIKNKVSYIVAARRSTFEPFMQYINNENARKVKPYFYDLNSKINYLVNKNNRIYLSCYVGKDLTEVEKFNQDYGNITGTLRYNHIFGEKLFSNTSLIYSKYNMVANQYSDVWSWKDQLGLEHYEFKNEFIYAIAKHKLEFGIRSVYYTFHPGDQQPIGDSSKITSIELPKQYALESAVFLNDNFKLNAKLEFQIGLRFSNFNYLGPADIFVYKEDVPRNPVEIIDTLHYEKNKVIQSYNHMEPRFSVKYNVTDNQVITISYCKMAQYVQLVSRTFNPLPYDMWKPCNNYIKPLTGNQYSAGWFYHLPEKSIDFSIESYYKTLNHVLEVKPGAELQLNSTLDAGLLQGIGRAYGIEFAAYKTAGRLTGTIGYTWSKTEKKIDGQFQEEKINFGNYYPSDYDIPNKITLVGEYKVSTRFFLTGNFIYQTGRPTTYPVGQYTYFNMVIPEYAGKNQDRLPVFHRLDAGAVLHNKHKDGKKWDSFWTFSLYNLYGRANYYSSAIRHKSGTRDTEAIKLWFFSVVPSISYSFKF